jgi:hypothetical protein
MSALPSHNPTKVVTAFTDHNRSSDGIGEKGNSDNPHADNRGSGQQVFVFFRQLALIGVVSHEEMQ